MLTTIDHRCGNNCENYVKTRLTVTKYNIFAAFVVYCVHLHCFYYLLFLYFAAMYVHNNNNIIIIITAVRP